MQYVGVMLPSTFKLDCFLQESCEQHLLWTSTTLSSACCLQNIGVLLLSTLKLCVLEQYAREQLLRFTFTMSH